MNSSFRHFHYIHYDISEASDKKCMAALFLLSLSAALYVTDNRILQMHQEYSYGLTGSAISWIKYYLSDKFQHITLNKVSAWILESWDHVSTVCIQIWLLRYAANRNCFTTVMQMISLYSYMAKRHLVRCHKDTWMSAKMLQSEKDQTNSLQSKTQQQDNQGYPA